jgi:hypothetical protein
MTLSIETTVIPDLNDIKSLNKCLDDGLYQVIDCEEKSWIGCVIVRKYGRFICVHGDTPKIFSIISCPQLLNVRRYYGPLIIKLESK